MKTFSSGQTILEILLALTLIILFLTGVIVLQLYAIRNVTFSQNKSLATKLAQSQLERAKVIRDSVGIDGLSLCLYTCFINDQLIPVAITPTGVYGQSLTIEVNSADCPEPQIPITPWPTIYKAISTVNWSAGAINITPVPELTLSSCITDWR
ncbi:hypothetical protein A2960_02360 [Candidatus Gottesmanbacteria bacterium RIFCSPLOWO2_01_FULL_39_12b]|uniref:Uncharacterized protein n=1 Tax=Candidatus Gottesmanbacteria bacterium RIFCSPLOWO2_01_FULL_39_12b TaxID=1798388 RepID=A0A1F6ARQ9_9BACT|nr:MAG: hypothetical protein A2960_02360 [Candidatus Gottesmanbacteria bacterium RIFCSPLOWO2_01_FULL_39_12b]